MRLLVQEYSPFEETPRLLEALQAVHGNISPEAFQDLVCSLKAAVVKRQSELRNEAQTRCYDELASKGIRGSAIIPVVEKTSFWQAASAQLIESFREQLLVRLKEHHR